MKEESNFFSVFDEFLETMKSVKGRTSFNILLLGPGGEAIKIRRRIKQMLPKDNVVIPEELNVNISPDVLTDTLADLFDRGEIDLDFIFVITKAGSVGPIEEIARLKGRALADRMVVLVPPKYHPFFDDWENLSQASHSYLTHLVEYGYVYPYWESGDERATIERIIKNFLEKSRDLAARIEMAQGSPTRLKLRRKEALAMKILRALEHKDRMKILKYLKNEPLTAEGLSEKLGLDRVAVLYHVAILKQADLLRISYPEGTSAQLLEGAAAVKVTISLTEFGANIVDHISEIQGLLNYQMAETSSEPKEFAPNRRIPSVTDGIELESLETLPLPAGAEESIVCVVREKPAINYVMATTLQINRGVKKIVLKARGRSISRAVDVAEITRLKYFPGKLKITDIRTGTEEIIDEDGSRRDISVIEIELTQV